MRTFRRSDRLFMPAGMPGSGGRGAVRVAAVALETDIETWVDVTPPAMNLSPTYAGEDSYGVQDVLPDPARPSDFYAFCCYQGVWKSSNYGKAGSWSKVSTGTGGSVLDTGRPWTAAISKNAARNPATPPTLYTANGYSATQQGLFKSTDGGSSWSHITLGVGSEDLYCLDVDPYDDTHLIGSLHDTSDVIESTDSGATWALVTSPASGISGYVFFLDTGSAVTTRSRWLHVPQDGSGTQSKVTTNGGTSWANVTAGVNMVHYHGCSQLDTLGSGELYLGSSGGVHRSTDAGANWTNVDSAEEQNGCVATSKSLFASFGWATHGSWSPRVRRRARAGGAWSNLSTPAGMQPGAKRCAAFQNGTYPGLIWGGWNGGIWRFVEAP